MRAVRYWLPIAAMMLLSLLSYIDRNVLAVLSPTILRDTGLSAERYGWIVSAFSAAYLVGNPFWGRCLDRFGLRVGLLVSVALWTCASVSHAWASTVLTFAAARAMLGFGEGATFPAGLRTATQALKPQQRARGVAVAYSGGSLGAILAPLLVTPIALRWGWRCAFLVTGVLGISWLLMWTWVSTDSRLRVHQPANPERRPRFASPSLWGFMAAYAFGGLPLGFVLYDAPLHLVRALGYDQATVGHVLWIPPLGWEVGYFFWGWVVDRAVRGKGSEERTFGRLFALLAVLAMPLGAASSIRSCAGVLALLFFATFVASGFVIASLAETTIRHSEEHAGYLAGLGAGSWSAVMMLAMPLFGRLVDHGAYGTAYVIAGFSPCLGWIGWHLLARPQPRPTAA